MIDLFAPRLNGTPFAEYIDTSGPCWLWTAATNRQGYGTVKHNYRHWMAHRLIWTALVGDIPEGMTLDHLCQTLNCVNPDHLRVMDGRTNILIGHGPPALNARKARCIKGHPLNGDNLYSYKGTRHCRICRLTANKRYLSRLGIVEDTDV